jgi:hypothetical protein
VGSTKVAESVVPAGESSSPASPGGEAQEALAALPAWVWVLVALGLLALFPVPAASAPGGATTSAAVSILLFCSLPGSKV